MNLQRFQTCKDFLNIKNNARKQSHVKIQRFCKTTFIRSTVLNGPSCIVLACFTKDLLFLTYCEMYL